MEDLGRVRLIDTNDGGLGTGGAPPVKHTFHRKSRENGDQRDAAGGGHVLAGGVVAHIQTAVGDQAGEAAEAAVPEGNGRACLGRGSFDALRLFAAGAAVHEERSLGGEQGKQTGFEIAWYALGGIFSYAQADGDIGARQIDDLTARCDIGPGAGNADSPAVGGW